ncbi:hypothetical protein PVK06_024085 [Gossypium arboreum]|uniref:SWIM-type domain-containing protein n=1 Tax=Gossypium arboreum TaxID=29729 RepID=A0ABR0PCT7_GOSAR|nr:hypothetical protein PVK06_024085 [Gossypium arboreum]
MIVSLGFDVEQNTLGGDFGGEASNSDDSSYKAYESDASYSNSFECDGDNVDEPKVVVGLGDDFDSNSNKDLKNELDSVEDGKEKYPLFNLQTDMRKPILVKGLVFPNKDILKDAIRQYSLTLMLKQETVPDIFTTISKTWKDLDAKRCILLTEKLLNVWQVYAGNENKYEVDCGLGNKQVVDLVNYSYSCRKWDLSRIPCKHVISCKKLLGVSPEAYANTCYSITTQLNIYSHLINPVKGPIQWEHVRDIEPILPPMIRRPLGIPKQTRRKEVDEERKSGTKLSKTRQQDNYTKCGKPGHNTRTCKGIVGL